MNAINIDTNITRTGSRIAGVAIVAALVLSFAIAALAAQTTATGNGALAKFGEYIAEVGEVLGSG